jgi:hypothetical protein
MAIDEQSSAQNALFVYPKMKKAAFLRQPFLSKQ